MSPREPHTTAMTDQIITALRDRGPCTTREVQEALGRPAESMSIPSRQERHRTPWWDAYRLLTSLHKRGVVQRAKVTNAVMWWLVDEDDR